MTKRGIVSKILHGSLGTAIFAITSACNYKCKMCDMWKQKPEFLNFNAAKKILEFLDKNKFLIAYFTGGEPTLHPNVSDIVEYADNLGLVTSLTTNGTISKKRLAELKNAGLYSLSVSLDHYDPTVCEEIRGFKGVFERAIDTIDYAKEIGMRVYTLSYLNPRLLENNGELEKMIEFVNKELGVPFGFCYPTNTKITTYKLGGTERIGDAQREIRAMERILKMIKNGSAVVNPLSYIEDVIKFNEHKEVRYKCKGGEYVCYIDWYGDFYPCFNKKKIFNVLEDQPKFLDDVYCNECLINCFREPSILPQAFSLNNMLDEIAKIIFYGSSSLIYF